jgi:peptide/nickel transport system substrate-binding protein
VKKFLASIVLAGLSLSLLSGCAGVTNKASFVPGSKLTVGESGPLVSLNSGLAGVTASDIAAADIAHLTMPAFFTPDATGKLAANTAFGSIHYNAGSIKFTLTGKAKWSDGTPITPTDLLLSYKAATAPAASGFNTKLTSTSLALTSTPVVSGNTLTLSHTAPIADWQTMLPITVAAHQVGKQAFSGRGYSNADAANAVQQALLGSSAGDLAAVAAAYNSVGAVANGSKPAGFVTGGAYDLKSVTASQVVLTANRRYLGPNATIETVTIDCFGSTDELMSAISAKKVDLAAPLATPGQTNTQIADTAKHAGFDVNTGDSGENEVIVLNHANQSSFSVAGAGGPKKSAAAQDAFFKFAPRAGIWNELLTDSSLNKTDSLVFASNGRDYSASTSGNGSGSYQYQNGEAAAEEWAAAGYLRTIPVRVLFDSNNPRAQLEYSQLSQWGKVSGFTIQNVSSDNPSSVVSTGAWDAYIVDLPRIGTSLSSLSTASGALTGLSVPAINSAVAKLAAKANLDGQSATLAKLDQLLFANYYGLPLFEVSKTVVRSKRLGSFTASSSASSVVWGYSNWVVSASAK